MAIFGLAFIRHMLAAYSAYQYILHPNEMSRVLFLTFIIWELSSVFSMLLVVYYADKLTNEVNEIFYFICFFFSHIV